MSIIVCVMTKGVIVFTKKNADFGVEHLVRLAGEMSFPWLMSNVRSSQTGELLADGKETHIIKWEGRKVRGGR